MKVKKSLIKVSKTYISVIVPAYKAEDFIEKNLLQIKKVMDQLQYPYEIICVVDGMEDKTYENALKIAKIFMDKITVTGYLTNLGKGHAVRFGMAKAKGEIIAFIDAGFDINPNGLSILLEHFKWYDADIIVGSKRHPVSKVKYPWQRKVLSIGYQILVRLLFGLKVRDTQTGIKFYKREVLEKTLPRLLVKAWAFDIEILAVANYLGFNRIYEAPIELKNEFGGLSVLTSKGFFKFAIGMIIDTWAVFYRLKILKFYDSKNNKNWITPDYLTFNSKK